jgi:hypothetical protein
MLDAWSLRLEAWIMTLLPFMVLKKPYRRPGPSARFGRRTRFPFANDWILIPKGIFFNAHRSKHLKLICPNRPCNLCTDCPEAVPDMLHQFF